MKNLENCKISFQILRVSMLNIFAIYRALVALVNLYLYLKWFKGIFQQDREPSLTTIVKSDSLQT